VTRTGDGQIGSFSVSESPFAGVVTLTGRIGDPQIQWLGCERRRPPTRAKVV
jgi:hypothetical protein